MRTSSVDAFARDGFALHRAAAAPALPRLIAWAAGADRSKRPGTRVSDLAALADLIDIGGSIGGLAALAIGAGARPVRAVLFDKSARSNWALGWHQDRTIVVRARRDVAGFGPWTRKAGLWHVAPPWWLLAGMVTLRIHLDPVDADNAPLRVAPASHRLGPIAEGAIDAIVARLGERECMADAGDVWIYATPILHASARAAVPRRRRVLQIDYAAAALPAGLAWLGVGERG